MQDPTVNDEQPRGPSLDVPSTVGFNRIVHGIRSKIGAVGPLYGAHDHPRLSKDVRVAQRFEHRSLGLLIV